MSRKQRGLATMIINVSPGVRTWIEKQAERSSDTAEIIKCIRAEMARERSQPSRSSARSSPVDVRSVNFTADGVSMVLNTDDAPATDATVIDRDGVAVAGNRRADRLGMATA
jgi:hypothetical protein